MSDFEVSSETLAWVLARVKRTWPHMDEAERKRLIKYMPEWAEMAEVSLSDPFVGRLEESEYNARHEIDADMLAMFVANVRHRWKHMKASAREFYAKHQPEVFEASGVRMDAPYLGPDPEFGE